MKITDVKIRKIFVNSAMKAIASVTFDNQLAVHDIKIINTRDRQFIVMPNRKCPDDTYRDVVHPVNSEFRAMIEEAVIAAYEAELEAQMNAPVSENAEVDTDGEI